MKAARVYKVNLKENVLRQVIFTDRNIFMTICALEAFGIYKYPDLGVEIKAMLVLFLCGITMIVFTSRIDRQPLIRILRRLLDFYLRGHKHRY